MFKPLRAVEATMSPDVHTRSGGVLQSCLDTWLLPDWCLVQLPVQRNSFWDKNEKVTFLVSGEDWTDGSGNHTHCVPMMQLSSNQTLLNAVLSLLIYTKLCKQSYRSTYIYMYRKYIFSCFIYYSMKCKCVQVLYRLYGQVLKNPVSWPQTSQNAR